MIRKLHNLLKIAGMDLSKAIFFEKNKFSILFNFVNRS